jgi:hypothetical protein
MDSETEGTDVPVRPLRVLRLRIYTMPKAKKDITIQVPASSSPAATRVFFTAGFAAAGGKARSKKPPVNHRRPGGMIACGEEFWIVTQEHCSLQRSLVWIHWL